MSYLCGKFMLKVMFFQEIIDKYYSADDNLRRLLIHHSRQVADRALSIARRHPEWQIDLAALEDAAMLHDIGICQTDAPGIHCHGTEPYLLHGRLGALMMRAEAANLEAIARVCERHTGTGLTAANIREQGLPLPEEDLLPETLIERIVCYADKFYSKSHPERERTVAQTAQSLAKFGAEGVQKFLSWAQEFEGYQSDSSF